MLLNEFNETRPDELSTLLRPCIDIQRWIEEVVVARPYTSLQQLFSAATAAANPFTDEEVAVAMSHHPRIGQRADGESAEAKLSRQEQASLGPTDHDDASALAAGNLAYEEKFGQVFLIRAAGRSPEEILAALTTRLNNTFEQETAIVAQQLREIALLRLKGVMS